VLDETTAAISLYIPTAPLKQKLQNTFVRLEINRDFFGAGRVIFKSLDERQRQWESSWSPEISFGDPIGGIHVHTSSTGTESWPGKNMVKGLTEWLK
jgi:hypothetical protein